MNIITKRIGKTVIKAVFICLMTLLITNGTLLANRRQSTMKTNSVFTPDFAYPQNVIDKTSKIYADAIKDGNGNKAISSAIELSIAEGLISQSNFDSSLSRFSEISLTQKAPYNLLALLLEAQIYADKYESSPWIYNNRSLPLNVYPDNVEEWSRELFAAKIDSLITKAVNLAENNPDINISDIKNLWTKEEDTDRVIKSNLSLTDFVDYKGIVLLNKVAPSYPPLIFGNSKSEILPSQRCYLESQKLLDEAIARNFTLGNIEIASFFSMIKYKKLINEKKHEWLEECYDKFSNSNYGSWVILGKEEEYEQNQQYKEALSLLTEYINKYPNADNINSIRDAIAELNEKKVQINHNNQILADTEWTAQLNLSGIYNFDLLLYKLKEPYCDQYSIKAINASQIGNLIKKIRIDTVGAAPDKINYTLKMPSLSPGLYVIYPSTNGMVSGIIGEGKNEYSNIFRVSNLCYFVVNSPDNTQDKILYVTDAYNQRPIEGARITRIENNYKDKDIITHYITGPDGAVVIPAKSATLQISYKGDAIEGDYYGYFGQDKNNTKTLGGKILTNLSIYKPGEKIEFAGVIWENNSNSLKAVNSYSSKVIFRDANYQVIDSLTIKTDEFGRFSGGFEIPQAGLLGSYTLQLTDENKTLSSQSVEVADYKSPSFYVDLNKGNSIYTPGDTIHIEGNALTYSGMPVILGKVKYTIRCIPGRYNFIYSMEDATTGGETVTDSSGNFSIDLPTGTIRNGPYAKALFNLSVSVTDGNGETIEASPITFSLGQSYSLSVDMPGIICANGADPDIKVVALDVLGKPVSEPIYYRILKDSVEIAGNPYIDTELIERIRNLTSGDYKIEFSLSSRFENKDDNNVCENFIVWREDDKKPPVTTPLWVPESNVMADNGAKELDVRIGSSYPDSYIFMQVSNDKKILYNKWINVNKENISVRLTSPGKNERLYVTLVGLHELETEQTTITVIPQYQTEGLEIETESFRDYIVPGAKENWKFKVKYKDYHEEPLPVIAVLSNKALNAISSFQWSFNPYSSLYWYNPGTIVSILYNHEQNYTFRHRNKIIGKYDNGLQIPAWQMYGYNLIGNRSYRNNIRGYSALPTEATRARNGIKLKRAQSITDEEELAYYEGEESVLYASATSNDAFMAESEMDDSKEYALLSDKEMQPVECPIAFFKPDLITDDNGIVEIDFTVPQYNCTWQLQLASYNDSMKGAVKILESVAAKKVMVSMNSPRYLRTGDRIVLSATIYNNSGEKLPVQGKIDIINPVNNSIISSGYYEAIPLDDKLSRIITLDYTVPTEMSSVIVRVYGWSDDYKDGEQAEIAVLPSSEPVIESNAFYISGAGNKKIDISFTDLQSPGNTTLQYTGNPIWECVTSLPSIITPDSENLLAHIDSFYGISIVNGLLNNNPQLSEALSLFANFENDSNSVLKSGLDKNNAIKQTNLINTPWVNNAYNETKRMQSLLQYTDSAKAAQAIRNAVKLLIDRQNKDGGWAWCPGMQSSTFITGRVLLHLAMLKGMDYFPTDLDPVIQKAFEYSDIKLTESWNNSKEKYFDIETLVNYLYIKSFFNNIKDAGGFDKLRIETMQRLTDEWEKWDIYNKATAAILEHRKGNNNLACQILESVTQLAYVSAEKGMWFDNLRGEYSAWNPLITTAQVLEAYAEILPGNENIDKLRQWLLISKQTEDWGAMRGTAEVVNAILTTGTDWIGQYAPTVITIGKEKLQTPEDYRLTDSFIINLTESDLSHSPIYINKVSPMPAWGGIVRQYVYPVKDITAAALPQLSIKKDIHALSSEGTILERNELKVGDRVRITLTVTCDRDMNYVSLTDSRSACLEPVEQISGYTSTDGTWYYEETRNTSTNLFIPYLSKGTHVLYYECFVERAGEYALGIANIQSQYAPVLTAHSAGQLLNVKPQ